MVYASKKPYAKKSYQPKKYSAKPKKSTGPKPRRKVAKMSSRPKFGKKSGSAVPTRIKSTNNVVSHSTWLSTNKPSYKVTALEKVGAQNIVVDSTTIAGVASLGCYGATQVPHMINPRLNYIFSLLPAAAGSAPRQFVLESYRSEVQVANQTNVIAEVELYDCVLKRDLPTTNAITTGNPAVPFALAASVIDYINKGMDMATASPSGTYQATTYPYGSSPYDSPLFKDYFKVVKRTVVEMSPGGVHQHVVSLKPNCLIREDVTSTSTMFGLRGMTSFTLVWIRPTAGIDVTSAGITTPQTQINVIQSVRYGFTWAQDIANSLNYANGVAKDHAPGDVVRGFNPLTGIGQVDTTIP